jgi:hypothetical protein
LKRWNLLNGKSAKREWWSEAKMRLTEKL